MHKKHGSVLVPLTQYPGRVQVFKQVLAPRQPELVTHEGYEWLYVLAGRLRLILGAQDVTLRPGEVAEFDTTEPHWFGPADTNTVEILHLFGPRGDQAVVRAGPSATDPAPATAPTPPSSWIAPLNSHQTILPGLRSPTPQRSARAETSRRPRPDSSVGSRRVGVPSPLSWSSMRSVRPDGWTERWRA